MKSKFRTPYDGVVVQPQLMCESPSLTKQSFRDECDVNRIMQRYAATGVLEHVREAAPQFVDVADAGSFQEAMTTVSEAESLFSQLPAATRAAFKNDCVTFLDAFSSDSGRELLLEHGLLEAPEPARSVPGPESAGGSPEDGAPPAVDSTE